MRAKTRIKVNFSTPHLCVLALLACPFAGCRSGTQPVAQAQPIPSTDTLVATPDSQTPSSLAQVAFDQAAAQGQLEGQLESQQADPEPAGVSGASADMIDSSPSESIDLTAVGNTLDALEAMAVQLHPAIVEARLGIEAARGQYVQAGLPFNPVLQYQSEEIGVADSAGLQSVRVSQQYVTANKLGLAQQVQAQAIAVRHAELQRAELQVLTNVRVAFAKALIAQQRLELTKQIVELTDQSVQSAQLLLQAQEVSKVTLLQAQVEAEQARIVAEIADTQLTASRRALSASIGLQQLSPGPLAGDLTADLTEQPWETLLQKITATSPELMAVGSQLEQARSGTSLGLRSGHTKRHGTIRRRY